MKIKCRKCGKVIDGSTQCHWEMEMCPCGAVGLDQTKHYVRLIGNPEDIIEFPTSIEKENKNGIK